MDEYYVDIDRFDRIPKDVESSIAMKENVSMNEYCSLLLERNDEVSTDYPEMKT
jgi:hypothetical protein